MRAAQLRGAEHGRVLVLTLRQALGCATMTDDQNALAAELDRLAADAASLAIGIRRLGRAGDALADLRNGRIPHGAAGGGSFARSPIRRSTTGSQMRNGLAVRLPKGWRLG